VHWSASEDGTLAAIAFPGRTILRAMTSTPPREIDVSIGLQNLAVSSRGLRVAGTAPDGRLVILRRDGSTEHEGKPAETYFDQLHFSPDESKLTYLLRTKVGEGRVQCLDIRTGAAKDLAEAPYGALYFSKDGSHMLLVARDAPASVASYYDMRARPWPALLATYTIPADLCTAAVADDGRRVAVEQLEEDSRQLCRVVLLDEHLKRARAPLVTETSAWGLEFHGAFLFVGIQSDPWPSAIASRSTRAVLVFDLS
jgi:hypothetical protein